MIPNLNLQDSVVGITIRVYTVGLPGSEIDGEPNQYLEGREALHGLHVYQYGDGNACKGMG